MKRNIELKWHELRTSYQPSDFSFRSIEELKEDEGIIGQESALKALAFGIGVEAKGYNIYISGDNTEELNEYICAMLKTPSQKKKVPDDLCYVYNFRNPEKPKTLYLRAGDGRRFKDDMTEFIQFLMTDLPDRLMEYTIERKKQKLVESLEEKKEHLLDGLKKEAQKLSFAVKITEEGIGFIPLNEKHKPLTEEAYILLEKEEKSKVKKNLAKLYKVSEGIAHQIKEVEKLYTQYIEDVDREFIMKQMGSFMKSLKENYKDYQEISLYLDEVVIDVLENIDIFLKKNEEEGKGLKDIFPWLVQKSFEDVMSHYRVNLLVDNSDLTGSPIITQTGISYSGLVGKIQLDSELSASKLDVTHIRPGLLHQANGGYLVLYAKDLFDYPGIWEAFKKTLKTGKVRTESMQNSSITSTVPLIPEPAEANIKAILIGSEAIYELLIDLDPEFKDLFKVVADFESYIQSDRDYILQLGKKLKSMVKKEKLPNISTDGLLRLVEFSNRLAGRQDKALWDTKPVMDLVREAAVFEHEILTKQHIDKVIALRKSFQGSKEKSIDEQYKKDVLMIDTKGRKVGQINGLAVYKLGECKFGRPIRITVTTYKGKSGLIDIEQEAGLSGSIHTKGIQILTGFLGHRFAQHMPLSLCCRICFEQSYGTVDGDSASSAELYGVLSSLAQVPIRQEIAVTGSINQYGQIQPIGGINEKIEGFYKVCKDKGLTGKQGVIIPYQNKDELMLDEEIVRAVKQEIFHIYPVKDFSEGIEILTTTPYPLIEDRVFEKLESFNDILAKKRNRNYDNKLENKLSK